MCTNAGSGAATGGGSGGSPGRQKISTNSLPKLTGVSEKQIKYGEDRRNRIINIFNDTVEKYNNGTDNERINAIGMIVDDVMFDIDGMSYRERHRPKDETRREIIDKTRKRIQKDIKIHTDAKWWIEH